jgi:hypothetical protein
MVIGEYAAIFSRLSSHSYPKGSADDFPISSSSRTFWNHLGNIALCWTTKDAFGLRSKWIS